MKRLYTVVSTNKEQGGYAILLDNRPVKTPGKKTLLAPNEGIANLIVQEWSNQGEIIQPDTMPIMQILTTQQDKVAHERDIMTPEILKFLNTDLLCYGSDELEDLEKQQDKIWTPHLKWFEKKFGIALETTKSIAAITHPQVAHDAVREYVEALSDAHFTIAQIVTPLSGSLILALKFVDRALDAQGVLKAAFVEEDYKDTLYNAKKHGLDPMTEKKKAAQLMDLKAAEQFMDAL